MSAPQRPGPLMQLGDYELHEYLGAGAMATVYRATLLGDTTVRRSFAIKLLNPNVASDPELVQTFQDEARLGGRLSHPNIVLTQAFMRDGDERFLVMEYVDGITLQQLLKLSTELQRPLDPAVICEIIRRVCLGLHHAHFAVDERGAPLRVVHRDVKPSNILIDRHGAVKISDFGVAKAKSNELQTLHAGALRGTTSYMSPEQACGSLSIDHRSDIFSLCIILYEMLSGQRLYPGPDALSLARRADVASALQALPPLKGRLAFVSILQRGLAFDPADRFQSAAELADRLDTLQSHLQEASARLEKVAADFISLMDDGTRRRPGSAASLARLLQPRELSEAHIPEPPPRPVISPAREVPQGDDAPPAPRPWRAPRWSAQAAAILLGAVALWSLLPMEPTEPGQPAVDGQLPTTSGGDSSSLAGPAAVPAATPKDEPGGHVTSSSTSTAIARIPDGPAPVGRTGEAPQAPGQDPTTTLPPQPPEPARPPRKPPLEGTRAGIDRGPRPPKPAPDSGKTKVAPLGPEKRPGEAPGEPAGDQGHSGGQPGATQVAVDPLSEERVSDAGPSTTANPEAPSTSSPQSEKVATGTGTPRYILTLKAIPLGSTISCNSDVHVSNANATEVSIHLSDESCEVLVVPPPAQGEPTSSATVHFGPLRTSVICFRTGRRLRCS